MRGAIAFLTPFGGARVPSPQALRWFAPVGAGLGLALGMVWWATEQVWPASVAAAIVVAADLAATGMLHFDGLVDSADGLLPHLDRARRLEVMASPEIGAFGVLVAGATLLARWAALAALRPAPLLLGGLWGLSRATMAAVVRTQPYARGDDGLASAFIGRGSLIPVVLGAAGAVALTVVWRPLAGPVSAAAGLVGALVVVGLARRRLGGFTGDVVGAGGVMIETVGLVVAAAKW